MGTLTWLRMGCLFSLVCTLLVLCLGCQHRIRSAPNPQASVQDVASPHKGPGIYHEVKPGQTLWSIARAYDVNVQTLAQVNRISEAAGLNAGQKLYVPGVTQARDIASRCPCGGETSPSPSVNKAFIKNVNLPERSSDPKVLSRFSLSKDIEVYSGTMAWPVQGEVSRGFEHATTRRHDGIDIVAPRGTAIRAVADGEVLFSGWGPGGYGQTVILQHKDDLITIYAHNDEHLVRQGQRVRQGEKIATVGRTGRALGYHLHFEVRYKTTPVSPYKFLTRRTDNLLALNRQ